MGGWRGKGMRTWFSARRLYAATCGAVSVRFLFLLEVGARFGREGDGDGGDIV